MCFKRRKTENNYRTVMRFGSARGNKVKMTVEEQPLLMISDMPPGARYIFESNPYCVLGISSSSNKEDAQKVRDKLQKLNNLKAVDSYYSEFDFLNIEKPNRELGKIQVVLENLGDMTHRWFWLRKAKHYAKTWKAQKKYVLEGEFNYDRFIIAYISLMIQNPKMTDHFCWDSLLDTIEMLLNKADLDLYQILKDSLSETEIEKYNYHMVCSYFRDSILTPIIMNLDVLEGSDLVSNLVYFKDKEYSYKAYFVTKIERSAFSWAVNAVSPVLLSMQTIKDRDNPTNQEIEQVEKNLDNFFEQQYESVEIVGKELSGKELYSERIFDKVTSVVWDATNVLLKKGLREKACKYDCTVYPHYKESQQQEIKRFYPYELQSLQDEEYSIEECKKAIRHFDEKNDKENKFIWLLKAAKKGDPGAQNDLGVAYALGEGTIKDENKAIEWYEKAATQGNGYALSNMASRYYYGLNGCKMDTERAEDYWIGAVVSLRRKKDIEELDEHFPGWRTSNHPRLQFSADSWEYELRPMAELGIPNAEYWYGYNILLGQNGCVCDCGSARRWMLLASAHGFIEADMMLQLKFNIDCKEAMVPEEMFNCGFNYSKSTEDQDKDLCFYWYYKAYHAGYKEGANNLGVCYDDGKGTDVDYKKANELYLEGISQNNAASYYNYGVNVYFGYGVEKNVNMARKHLLKAASLGHKKADEFIIDHPDLSNITYEPFDVVWYERKDGIYFSFDKLKSESTGIRLTFWIKNSNEEERTFWVEQCLVDGELYCNWESIVTLGAEESGFFDFVISGRNNVRQIRLKIEVDKAVSAAIFSYPELTIDLNQTEATVAARLENQSSNALCDFESVAYEVYSRENLCIVFSSVEIDDEELLLNFWVSNSSDKVFELWAMDVHVDGCETARAEDMGAADAGKTCFCNLKLDNIDFSYGSCDIDFYIEIDDNNSNKLGRTRRISIEVDFDTFSQEINLLEGEAEEVAFQDVEFVVYDDNDIYVEFCNIITENEASYLRFWAENETDSVLNIYAKDISVDKEVISYFESICRLKPGESGYQLIRLKKLSPELYYSIKAKIEIDNEEYETICYVDALNIDVDFGDGNLSVEME